MQFSAIVNRFIVKTKLNSAFTNDSKRKENFSKNVHSCRLSLFNDSFFCKRPILIYICMLRELFMFLFSSADFLQN